MSATRIRDGLICLAEAPFDSLQILLGVRPVDTGEIKARASGDWAYRTVRDAFLYEDRATWGGWYAKPRHHITWDELDGLTADDPRLAEVRAWSASLTAVDAWRDRTRPFRLTPGADEWHPHYHEGDVDRPGWDARLHAWEQAIAILRDAAERAPEDPVQLTIDDYLGGPA